MLQPQILSGQPLIVCDYSTGTFSSLGQNSSTSGFRELSYRIFQSVCSKLISSINLHKLIMALSHFKVVAFLRSYMLVPFAILLDLEGVEPMLRPRLEKRDGASEAAAD